MKKSKFNIQGMTCSSCSAHVEKAVKKLEGIEKVNVNLLSNNMVVEYNEKILNEKNIIKVVVEAGYGASLDNEIQSNKKGINNNDIIKQMKKRIIISICFLIPLMYIAMHQMIYKWLNIPVPLIIKKIFDGNENAIIFGITQLLLLIPIIYVNRTYFIIGYKRLFKRKPNMDSLIAIGSSAAILYGIFAIYMIGYSLGRGKFDIVEKYSMDMYFESAGMILTLITIR